MAKRIRRWLLTSAQNETDIHKQFWSNLHAYAAHINAELLIGPFTYNVGAFTDHTTRHNAFATALHPYLAFERLTLGNVLFCAEMNTLPTAVRPLSGLTSYTQGHWGIFPHAKVQLETVPTMPGQQPPIIMTTGCCTIKNYTPRKAGVKASFHHVIGATLLEIDPQGRHFCRQLNATEDGSFQDLDTEVKNGRVYPGKRVEAITWGDIHTAQLDPAIAKSAWGLDPSTMDLYNTGGMIDVLRPKHQFFHDLFDGESINHWIENNPLDRYELFVENKLDVETEVRQACEFLRASQRSWCQSHVVESNHDCLSMDTEALTQRGWVSFDEIKTTDKVLSFDPATETAVWSEISSKFSRKNTEEMYHISGSPVDMLITPRHRVLCKGRGQGKWGDWAYFRPIDGLPSRMKIPVAADSKLPEYSISDDWLTLSGWLLTDGCIFDDRGHKRVTFCQSKPCPSFEDACKNLNLPYHLTVKNLNYTHVLGRKLVKPPKLHRGYHFRAKENKRILEILPQKATLPDWVYQLSERQFNILLEAIIAGDGTWGRKKGIPHKTCAVVYGKKKFLDSLQAACVLHGWRAHLVSYREKDWKLNLTRITTWEADSYLVTKKAQAESKVWCLSVPLTNFMVRRNGKPFFTGNCWVKRWLQTPQGNDLTNRHAYHRWNLACIEASNRQDWNFSIFRHVLKENDRRGLAEIDFIPEGNSFKICTEMCGIECGLHGHRGSNGSRGSTVALSRLGTKINKGHDHTAAILDGTYSCGVCGPSRRLLRGPSTWSASHILTYPNSKRSIITMQEGKWRA